MEAFDSQDTNLLADYPLQDFLIQTDLSNLTKTIKKSSNESITINIKCVYPNPNDPSVMTQTHGSQTCNSSQKVQSVVDAFLKTYPEIPRNREYYLGYDQLLFREGTLRECGITHGKTVELYAPGKNAAAYHNEGLCLIVWSIIPFAIGLAALLFSITTTNVDNEAQALALFIGFLLVIPSTLLIIIGLILIPKCPMPCYFVGTNWF